MRNKKHQLSIICKSDERATKVKLAIIQREFDQLYDPNHQGLNNMEMQGSVEELEIIQEVLN